MKTKIFENENLSPDFKNLVQYIINFEINFDINAHTTLISDATNEHVVSLTDVNHFQLLLQKYCESDFEPNLKKIKKHISFEESYENNRRRIYEGIYHSRTCATFNYAFLKLYKNIILGIDAIIEDSAIDFINFEFSKHKKFLNLMSKSIKEADNKNEERGKTSLYYSLEKECFEFYLLLKLLKIFKKLYK